MNCAHGSGGGNATPDAFARLRPLLAGSENLIVATGIANVWAWEPAQMRAEAEDLAGEFPGRFILGLGVSHAPLVASLGHSYLRPLRKMEKFLDELDHPAQHGADRQLPPIVLAALGPKMLRLSGDQTLGAHPYFTTPEHTAFARSVLGPSPLLVPSRRSRSRVTRRRDWPPGARTAGVTCGCRTTRATWNGSASGTPTSRTGGATG